MIHKQITKLLFLLAIFGVGCTVNSSTQTLDKKVSFEGLEFKMPTISEPVIPGYTVSITDFGAVNGGEVLNTQAFSDAINAVSEKGGGKVIIPAGVWLVGPIILKSNLELHAESGALIVFSEDKDLYPLIRTNFEGLDTWRCLSPIYGKEVENVAFTGKGVWDGSGGAWRFVKKSKLTSSEWKKLVASGGIVNKKGDEWYPSEQYKKGMENADQNIRMDLKTKEEFQEIRDFLRPVMVSIQNSKRIMIDGPTFQNSPAWCIHPFMVEDLLVRNVTVRNPWYSQNGDGIDVESCKNVLVESCSFDVGDDAICIKSGKNEEGRRRGAPCENLVIRDNIVYHGHGGVTVGSEMSGGVKNMHVSNCTFIGTDVGLRFKSNRGRGGVVENIFISEIQMKDIPTFAISFNLYYGGMSAVEMLETEGIETATTPEPVTEETPQFKDIEISDVTVNGAKQALLLQGLPEMNLENVKLRNMFFRSDKGMTVIDASDIEMDNINLATKDDKAIEIVNASNVKITGLNYPFKADNAISIKGEKCGDISISGVNQQNLRKFVKMGDKVNEKKVKLE